MNLENRDGWDEHWSNLNDITMLNPAQHYRHKLLIEALAECIALRPYRANIYDFGSGQGDLVAMLASKFSGRSFTGLELSGVGVEISKAKAPTAKFRQCNLLEDSPPHTDLYGQCNIGICAEVLEHLDEPRKMLSVIKRYLAPGALLIITVPSGPMNSFEKAIGHRKHYQPEELMALVESAGLSVLRVQRAGFPFFNLYKLVALMRGEKLRSDANGNSGVHGLMMFVLRVFDFLFERFNFRNSPFGWQLMLIAEKPSGEAGSF